MKKVLQIILLSIGIILGAGFMTGKEIVTFFANFGYYSLIFIPFVFGLFYFLFYKILSTDKDYIENKLNKKTNRIIVFVLNIVLSAAMFSALRSVLTYFFETAWVGIFMLILLVISMIACYGGVKRLVNISMYLVPFMLFSFVVIFIVGLCFKSNAQFLFSTKIFNLPMLSVLYVMYNMSLGSVVISKAGEGLNKTQIKKISFISTTIISVIITIGIVVICRNASDIILAEMPFLALAEKAGLGVQIFILISIVFACITTLLSVLVILRDAINKTFNSLTLSSILACIITFIVSFIGFEKIVEYVYPIAAIGGTYLILSLFYKTKKREQHTALFRNNRN